MYPWVTHTWNVVKGICPHDCSYCYMKRLPQLPLHYDEKALKDNLGENKVIFVGSSCDIFADKVDAIVQVVRSGKALIPIALRVKEQLSHAKAKVLGIILNDMKTYHDNFYYRYYRYYGEKESGKAIHKERTQTKPEKELTLK